ncbi:MAG: hypothetical protein ABI395_09895 [Sphingobium sp.]
MTAFDPKRIFGKLYLHTPASASIAARKRVKGRETTQGLVVDTRQLTNSQWIDLIDAAGIRRTSRRPKSGQVHRSA